MNEVRPENTAPVQESVPQSGKQTPQLTGWAARFQRKNQLTNCVCGADGGANCNCSPQPWFGVYY